MIPINSKLIRLKFLYRQKGIFSLQLTLLWTILLLAGCEKSEQMNSSIIYNADIIRSIEDRTFLTDTDGKIASFDSLLVNATNLTKREIYEIYNLKVNYSFNHYHNYKLALLQLDTVEQLAQDLHLNTNEFVGIYALKSNTLNRLKRYSESLMQLEELRDFIYKSNDTSKIYFYYQNSAYLEYSRANFLEAAKNLKSALHTLPLANESDTIATIREQEFYNSIGLCYEKTNFPDSALKYYHKGLQFLTEAKKKHQGLTKFLQLAEAVYWGNIGSTMVQINAIDSAKVYYLKSIEVNSKPGNEMRDAAITRLKLVDLMLNKSELQQAKLQLDSVNEYLAKFPNDDLKQRQIDAEIELFTLSADTSNLVLKLKESDALKAKALEMLKLQNEKMLEDVKVSFDQKLEIRELKQKDKFLMLFILALSLFSLVIVGLFFKIRLDQRALKKANNVLDGLNKTTQEQNENLKTSLAIMQSSLTENEKLLQILAHDIRNPIGASIGLIDLFLTENKLNDNQKEIIELLQKTNTDLLVLLDDVMYAKKDLGKLAKSTINLKSLVTYTVQLMQVKANAKSQQIVLEQVMDISAYASELNLWRVLCNLLANSIKFSDLGKSIYVSLYTEKGDAIFKIKDEGIGMKTSTVLTDENLATIDRQKGTAGEESFGFGLRTAKKIVEAHNGSIWYESNGTGTSFYIRIPLH